MSTTNTPSATSPPALPMRPVVISAHTVPVFDGVPERRYSLHTATGMELRELRPDEPILSLSVTELSLFLEGCTLIGKQPLSPPPLSVAALRATR